jgi:hypothetical protein
MSILTPRAEIEFVRYRKECPLLNGRSFSSFSMNPSSLSDGARSLSIPRSSLAAGVGQCSSSIGVTSLSIASECILDIGVGMLVRMLQAMRDGRM